MLREYRSPRLNPRGDGSDAMRGAVQRHFGVRLAFQNCCKVGLFRDDATAEYERFISPRAQLLNQRPELLNC
jgi:hypothetical protein